MSRDDLFGNIRALFHSPPDELHFEKLCALLEEASIEALEAVYLPYVLAHISYWEENQRVMPWQWIEGIMRGERRYILLAPLAAVLNLSWRKLRQDQLERILANMPLHHITHLYLEDARLTPSSLERIVHHEGLRHVRVLGLAHNPLSKDGAAVLAQASSLRAIEELDVERCVLDDDALEIVLQGPCFGQLRRLDLSANLFDVKGMEVLAAAPQRHTLEGLNLTSCLPSRGARGARGGAMFGILTAAETAWPALRQLELGWWGFGPRDAALFDTTMCGRLHLLDLQGSQLRVDGAQALSQCEALSQLQELDIRRNLIQDEGLLALVAPDSSLDELRRIHTGWNCISTALIEQLRARGDLLILP